MKENRFILLPINFNCWKHHAGFIKKQFRQINSEKDTDTLNSFLLKIGESQMDLYYGKSSPAEISKQIIKILNQRNIASLEQYQNWLAKEKKNYQLVELKDKSVWTLRLGEEPKRYVHAHPGRYSPHTIRVKATTLKTAILILCFRQAGEIKSIETDIVNFIRKKYLNKSHIKSLSNTSGLGRMINLLSKKHKNNNSEKIWLSPKTSDSR